MIRKHIAHIKSLSAGIVLVSILLIVLIPTISSAATLPSLPDPERIQYKPFTFVPPTANRVILKNGLVLYILEDHELPLIKITALIRTGSMQKLAFREFGRLMHEGSPRGRLVTQNSVKRIQREDLFRNHDLFYHPERVMISISGDIDRNESESIINRYFGRWKSSETRVEVPPLPHPQEEGILFLPKDTPQSVIIFGWTAPSKNDPQFPPFEIIDFITGSGGFRSKMFQKIRTDRGLAYSAGSFYTAKSEYGFFGAYALTKSESTIEVISLIRGIIQDINKKPVLLDELKKTKSAIINRFIFSFSSADKIAFQQMMTEYEDLPEDYLIAYRDNIEKMTVNDILKAARYLDPKRAIILIIGNDAIYREISGFETVRKIEGSL